MPATKATMYTPAARGCDVACFTMVTKFSATKLLPTACCPLSVLPCGDPGSLVLATRMEIGANLEFAVGLGSPSHLLVGAGQRVMGLDEVGIRFEHFLELGFRLRPLLPRRENPRQAVVGLIGPGVHADAFLE